jgi:uncharacterized protein (TIGR00255 family)
MAVYSMTGYASASTEALATAPQIVVEARSVNGRFLDLALRLPDEFRGLEPALRELLTGAFKRGKIELRVASGRDADSAWPQPTHEQLNRLSRLECSVQAWLPKARGLTVNEALQWCRSGESNASPEALHEQLLAAAGHCVAGLREARAREGERLAAMLRDRLGRLRELSAQAQPLVPAVVARQQQRFLERWQEAVSGAHAASGKTGAPPVPDEALRERAMSEAASYAIRIDVAEELTRLASHIDEIERLLKAGGELGKRLDFLIQELQREANTLGSKSAALELTNIAVEMKVAIEQMREQVQNIE